VTAFGSFAVRAARFDTLIVGVIAFGVLAVVSQLTPTVELNYTLQADAWLHGRIDVRYLGPWLDYLPWRDGWYVIEPPFPALLMVPLVLLFGPLANQTLLAVVLGSMTVAAGWELCKRLGTSLSVRIALVAFLALGTDVFWCSMLGDVWFVAHLSAVCFTLLAFVELAGKRRGWLVALFGAAAGFSRYPLLPVLLIYPFLLDAPNRRRAVAAYAATLFPFFAVWVWYNEIRWGTPADSGYSLTHQLYLARYPHGHQRMLDVNNVPAQLRNMLTKPPYFVARPPWVGVDRFGLGLLYTSPALILAFLARRPRRLVIACWLLAAGTALPSLLYFDEGGVQFGMRHALDFEPFVFVLMALGLGRHAPTWAFVLLGWSVAVGAWGLWFWHVYPPGTTL
jgi:hypothetical protein